MGKYQTIESVKLLGQAKQIRSDAKSETGLDTILKKLTDREIMLILLLGSHKNISSLDARRVALLERSHGLVYKRRLYSLTENAQGMDYSSIYQGLGIDKGLASRLVEDMGEKRNVIQLNVYNTKRMENDRRRREAVLSDKGATLYQRINMIDPKGT